MRIHIRQDSQYKGKGFWKWSIWIDAPEKELNQIESVTYRLDPSFGQPIQIMTNRKKQFRLEASGYSEFRIDVSIKRKGGRISKTMHWLELPHPMETSEKRGRREQAVVYLTYGAADADLAAALRDSLEARNVKVITSQDAPPDVPLQESMRGLIEETNIAIAIVSEATGPWVEREAELFISQNLPVIPIFVSQHPKIPSSLRGIVAFPMTGVDDANAVAQKLVDQIGKPQSWRTLKR